MTVLAELLPPDSKLKVPEIETYRGFESRSVEGRRFAVLTEVELGGRRRPLAKPLSLKLLLEGEEWFAENDTLNLFGTGGSPRKAIDDFREHFAHFVSHYRSLGWSEVSGEGKRLKMLYEQLLGTDAA